MSNIVIILIVQSIICGFIGHLIYEKNGGGFFLGLLLGVFGIITAAILSLDPEYKKWKKDKPSETKQGAYSDLPRLECPKKSNDDFTEQMMVEQDKRVCDASRYTKRQIIDMEIERRYGKR